MPEILPRVSVLMPCYQAIETLDEALQSLANQTLVDFEVIVVNDGSNDGSLSRLQEWVQRDRRFRVFSQLHAGIIRALNCGLDKCRAAYVARMDSDDRCHPERLARQVAYLDSHPEIGVVSCQVNGFPEDQVRKGFQFYIEWLNALQSDADIRREIFVESPLPHPSVTFRRELVRAAGGYQERGWPEDYDLWLRLYLSGVRFARLPEVLLDWRERPERLTRADARYSLENFLRAKAHYLMCGPLVGRCSVIIWGAGMMGRRLSKHLSRVGAPLVAFVDIDPRKIGNTRRGLPIISPEELPELWARYTRPIVLAAVGARGARPLVRKRLNALGLQEGEDWWSVA